MINSQASGVPERGAYGGKERREPAIRKRTWRKSRQTPILPEGIEQVRRRPDGKPAKNIALPAPGVTARRIHTDSEIGDQPNAHSGFTRPTVCYPDRTIRQPLQETMEAHIVLMRCGEHGDGGTRGVTQVDRPLAPVAGHLLELHRMQRLEHGMLGKQFASIGAELREVSVQPMSVVVDERLIGLPQQRELR